MMHNKSCQVKDDCFMTIINAIDKQTKAYPVLFIIAAKCVVFIPGAAHISTIVASGGGFSRKAGKQLA